MATVQLTVTDPSFPEEPRHLTLVHFEREKTPEAFQAQMKGMMKLCTELTLRNRGRVITGVWGETAMYGKYRNVKVRKVVSPAVVGLHRAITATMDEWGLPWSKFYRAFEPHVSNPHVMDPLHAWRTGEAVPFIQGIDLVAKPKSAWFEL